MLQGFLSENIMCMLAYNDTYASIIRNTIPLNLWSGPYRILASRIYNHIDQFKVPPKDHLPDILSDKLESEGAESDIYRNLVIDIRNAKEGINEEYVSHQLEIFIKRQSFRSISVELTKALQTDTEESLERAEHLIEQARRQQLQVFDPGTRLSDKNKSLRFLDLSNDCFPTGIPELDKRGLGPTRKEYWQLVADKKKGKSMMLSHLGKMALLHRLKVVHITLEMSEARVSQRYFQTLYSIAKRPEISKISKFKKDDRGIMTDFIQSDINPKYSLQDPDIRKNLENLIDQWAIRQLNNIYIKEFPTSSLTINQLEGYLDNLAATKKFHPDLLILDYPDLMKLDRKDLRLSLDALVKRLRGLAVERNIALATVSQSNRAGSKAKLLDADSIAEAYSKTQDADVTLTLSMTSAEKRLGLARLYVAAGRNDEDGFTVVISQHYKTGTFVLDSAMVPLDYWSHFEGDDETIQTSA